MILCGFDFAGPEESVEGPPGAPGPEQIPKTQKLKILKKISKTQLLYLNVPFPALGFAGIRDVAPFQAPGPRDFATTEKRKRATKCPQGTDFSLDP